MLNIPGFVSPLQPDPQTSSDPFQNTNLHPAHKQAILIQNLNRIHQHPPPPTRACSTGWLADWIPGRRPLRGPLRDTFGATHPPPPLAAESGHKYFQFWNLKNLPYLSLLDCVLSVSRKGKRISQVYRYSKFLFSLLKSHNFCQHVSNCFFNFTLAWYFRIRQG